MATSTPHIPAVPRPTATANPPRPTATTEVTYISPGGWQPEPEPISLGPGFEDPIVSACLSTSISDEYYFLELLQTYELRASPGGNYSLTELELSGFYNLNGNMVPDSPGFRPMFSGQMMELVHWTPNLSNQCAHFTFSIQVGTRPSDGRPDGTLDLLGQDTFFSPRILITSANATLLPQASPETTPTPTFGGGLDSTVDSSIGQSTNETALPASGNVPVSPSSSSSSPKASVIAPAIVVPVVFVLAALAAFFLWRRHRRARLAPSAAFRADNADAVEAMQRQGGTVGLGGTGSSQVPTAGVSLPAQSSSYFPLDEKRPLGP